MKTWNAVLGLLVVMVLMSSSALAGELEIRVAPRTLVLSSAGGKLTVHTNVPFRLVRKDFTVLKVNGTEIERFRQFYDDRLNLVVQCSKEAVKEIFLGASKERCKATAELGVSLTYDPAPPDGGELVYDDENFFVKP